MLQLNNMRLIKIIAWFSLVFFFHFKLTANDQIKTDSLFRELAKQPDNVILFLELAEILSGINSEQADSLALRAFDIAKREENILQQAEAASIISNIAFDNLQFERIIDYSKIASELYLQSGDLLQAGYYANDVALAAYEMDLYDVSLHNYQKTIRLLIENESTEFLPAILINIAQVYMRVAKYDSAIFYNERAIALSQQAGMEAELSAGYGNIGFVYKSMGNYTKALEKYQKALEISKNIDDADMIAVDLNNIASIYLHWENYEMAGEYFRQALAIHQKNGALDKAETTMNNLAFVLQKQGDYDGAMSLYRESLAIALSLHRTGSVAVKMANIGGLHFELGNLDSAIYYQEEALRLSRELGRRFSECSSLQSLAAIYVEIDEPEQADFYLEQAQKCATEIQANSILEKIYSKKSEFHEKQGDHAKALEAYRKHIAYRDSVFTKENKARLDELEAVYQSEKQQHEIELLLKDKELNEARINRSRIVQYWLGSGLTFLILASALVTWLLMQKSKANRKLVEKNLELMRKEECDDLNFLMKTTTEISEEEKTRLVSELELLIRKEKIFTIRQLTLNDLAARLNTNTSYLSGIINNDFGRPFKDFINQYRIKEAQKMFADGRHKTMTIEAIAETVGFQSRSTFHTSFKKFTGVTPTVYLKNVEQITEEASDSVNS
jgi:tetratricopeptide (TPR) repeat protein/AraC-like DNA-binding protein